MADSVTKIHQNRVKICKEYEINCSPNVLFDFISTPTGLATWFADDVNVKDKIYKFNWEGNISTASISKIISLKSVKFKWLNNLPEEEYLEFEIKKDDITGDVALFITDFANASDVEAVSELIDISVGYLRNNLGAK